MINLTVGNASNIGGPISQNNFGVNFLFNRDQTDRQGTYDDVIRDIGVETIRYPGGTMTEFAFDMENPDAEIHDWSETGLFQPLVRTDGHTGLNDFLDYVARDDLAMTFVMPTLRFVGNNRDINGDRYDAIDVELVREFTQKLLTDANNKNVPLQAIEIGNEWWAPDKISPDGRYELTATEYGRIASRMSEIVQDEINKFKSSINQQVEWVEPEIVIQTGHTDGETSDIFAQFDREAEQRAVDATLLHKYEFGGIENIANDVDRHFDQFDVWNELVAASSDAGFKEDTSRYVTEWNIFETNENHNGLRQASAILQSFTNQIQYKVDHANFWAVQRDNDTDLSGNEGQSELKAAGEMFKLMSESLPGKSMVDVESDRDDVKYHAFRDTDHVILFVSSRADTPIDINLDAADLVGDYSNVYAKQLGVAEGEDPREPDAEAVVRTLWKKDLENNDTLQLNLDPYEVARITFVRDMDVSTNISKARTELSAAQIAEATKSVETNEKILMNQLDQSFSSDIDVIYDIVCTSGPNCEHDFLTTKNGASFQGRQLGFDASFDGTSVKGGHLIYDQDGIYEIQQTPWNGIVNAAQMIDFTLSGTFDRRSVLTATNGDFDGMDVHVDRADDSVPAPTLIPAGPGSDAIIGDFEDRTNGRNHGYDSQNENGYIPFANHTEDYSEIIYDDALSFDRSFKLNDAMDENEGLLSAYRLPAEKERFFSYMDEFEKNFVFNVSQNSEDELRELGVEDLASDCMGAGSRNDFTSRYMWGDDGEAELYLHHMDTSGQDSGSFKFRDEDDNKIKFESYKWYKLMQDVKIYDDNQKNEDIDIYMDREQLFSLDDLQVGKGNPLIDSFYHNSFFGGSHEGWAPEREVDAYFDDCIISTNGADVGLTDGTSKAGAMRTTDPEWVAESDAYEDRSEEISFDWLMS